jgi:hypothetical protein
MNEARAAPRRRMLKSGSIAFGGGAITCTVRNLSSTGAGLDVASPVGIPDQFTLISEIDQGQRRCTVVWRKEGRIGVVFAE